MFALECWKKPSEQLADYWGVSLEEIQWGLIDLSNKEGIAKTKIVAYLQYPFARGAESLVYKAVVLDRTKPLKEAVVLKRHDDENFSLSPGLKRELTVTKKERCGPKVYLIDGGKQILARYANAGTLFDFLESRPFCDRQILVKKALEACLKIWKEGILHGDIKKDNFLVQEDKEGDVEVWLSDFGCSKKYRGVTSNLSLKAVNIHAAPFHFPLGVEKAAVDEWILELQSFGLLCASFHYPIEIIYAETQAWTNQCMDKETKSFEDRFHCFPWMIIEHKQQILDAISLDRAHPVRQLVEKLVFDPYPPSIKELQEHFSHI